MTGDPQTDAGLGETPTACADIGWTLLDGDCIDPWRCRFWCYCLRDSSTLGRTR